MVDLSEYIARVVRLLLTFLFTDEPIGSAGKENWVYLQGGRHPVSLYTVSILKNLRMKIKLTLHEKELKKVSPIAIF